MNNIYGGINYPNSSLIFDKIYDSKTAARENANKDTVLIGRYILIKYSDANIALDRRYALENDSAKNITNEEQKYIDNFKKDNSQETEKVSWDKTIFRKIYKNGEYDYEFITSLNFLINDQMNFEDLINMVFWNEF